MITTVLTRGLYLSAKVTSNTRQRPLKLFKRWYQVGNAPEAFLERLEPHPGITCLNLNRPKSKNAISTTLLQVSSRQIVLQVHSKYISIYLSNSMTAWRSFGLTRGAPQLIRFIYMLISHSCKNSVRVLILRSTTVGSFCAGADLVERRTMTQTQVTKFLSSLRDALARLESLPVPTIAAIDGPALGGGLEMSLACDLRVAGQSIYFVEEEALVLMTIISGQDVTKIGLPETSLGIIPGAGGTQRVTRILGPSKAKDLIFTARTLTAVEALGWGISVSPLKFPMCAQPLCFKVS